MVQVRLSSEKHDWKYNEHEAENSGNYLEKGYELLGYLFEN